MASRFTVRVLLEDARPEVYTLLHERMAKRKFSKFITGSGGVRYDLPQAEYNFIGERDPRDILTLAREAAEEVHTSFQILVSPSEPRLWYGLDKAEASERLLEAMYRQGD